MTVNKKTDGMGVAIAVVGLVTALKLAKLAGVTVLHDDPDKGVTFEKLSPEEWEKYSGADRCVNKLVASGVGAKAAEAICSELHPKTLPSIALEPQMRGPFDGIIDMLKMVKAYVVGYCVTRSIISGLEAVNAYFTPEDINPI